MQHIIVNWKKNLEPAVNRQAGYRREDSPNIAVDLKYWEGHTRRKVMFEISKLPESSTNAFRYHTVDSVEACSWVIDRVYIDLRDSTHFSFFRQY